ncbi:MAG TPA: dihydrolipoamide acetyltransferase family protein [Thermomicrobiales bacterium]|nr:dihydrolipoamide acetyltransferase family protein [Thermomicrobiales bacterium]
MANVIMPKMGDAMEEGTLLRWLKQVGDQIEVGDPIAEIETDKVSLEIEATEGGVLTKTLVDEGQAVAIGTPIATIGAEGETAEAEPEPVPAQAEAPASPAGENAVTAQESQPVAAQQPINQPEPAAAGAGTTTATPPPAGTNGAGDATAISREPGERLRASPIVKRLAAEHGIDLNAIAGSGPGGRIVKDDVMPYVTGAKQAPAAPQPAQQVAPPVAPQQAAPAAAGAPGGVARAMPRIRKITGERMFESKDTIPHFYVSSVVEMDAAAAFREQINAQAKDDESKVSFNDLIVKAAALALREFPNLNTSLEGDTLYDHANIDINIAVAIEGGLIAPFVRDADSQSLGAIARTTKDIVGRARKGGLEPSEYQGGTFTITNLGMYDVSEFIAIINPPQAAILAIGSIAEMPVVKDGRVTVGRQMPITLSADHRITDGAEVAKFLIAVKGYLQNPMQLALS